jgi:serine phosphatase RsbU (regulator of sigma subunit)
MTSMGYFVVQRLLANERRVVALSRELDLARDIQRSILPGELPQPPGLSVAARYLPASDNGGDLYHIDTRHPDRQGVLVADVTRHGVPAALVATMVKIAFAAEAHHNDDTGRVFTNMNPALCGRFAGAYVTACCSMIDRRQGVLRYASAGHPAPLVRHPTGHVSALDDRGLLLAFDPTVEYTATTVSIHPGDRVLFYSDGLVEAANPGDEFFGDERLELLLAGSEAGLPDGFLDRVVTELRRWIGPETPYQDDVTIVAVDVEP